MIIKGKLVDYDIFESVIKSRKQMTYKEVNSIIEKILFLKDMKNLLMT